LYYRVVMTASSSAAQRPHAPRRRPRGAVRDGLVAAGLELARTGGPDAVVLREATRMVGVVPNAAYRHFADRDELLAAVCAAAMRELADRMATGVARVRGKHGDAAAAGRRLHAIGAAYLEFAREEPGLFATAFAVPQQHAYSVADAGTGPDRTPLGHLRAALDELVAAGVLDPRRREGIEYAIWSTVHGLAVLTGAGPLRAVPDATRDHLTELTLAFIDESIAKDRPVPLWRGCASAAVFGWCTAVWSPHRAAHITVSPFHLPRYRGAVQNGVQGKEAGCHQNLQRLPSGLSAGPA